MSPTLSGSTLSDRPHATSTRSSDEDVNHKKRRLFLKWRVHQQIDGRYRPVARDEALAKIPEEVVGGCLRPRGHEPTARLGKFLLHVKAREFTEDLLHLLGRDQLDAEPAIVEPDAHRAQGDFRLLVKRD